MTVIRTIVAVAALGMATASISVIPAQARAQGNNPFQELRTYDYQNRKPVHAIFSQIQAAGTDKAKQAAIETALIGVLQDPNATVAGKQEAARFLWEIGSARSVPVLSKMLPDPGTNNMTNNMARYALERNTDPSAAAALRYALSTAKGTALVGVINSLGNRGDALAVPALKALASSPDPLVTDAAITALGKVGMPASVAALKSLPNKGLPVYNAFLRSAEKQASSGNRGAALSLYESMTGTAYPEVIRAGALSGLASLNSPRTGAIALSVAESASDPILQRGAARIAGTLETPADTQRSVAAWAKLPAAAQVALLSAWSDRRESAASAVTVDALRSDNPDIRRAAIRAAARICGASVVPTLANLASSGDQQQAAREALAGMGGSGVEPALISIVQQGAPALRTTVIGVLAERPTPASTAALVKAAGGSDPRVASAALKALGRTAGVDQEAHLVQILTATKYDDVRDSAQNAIVAIAQRTGDRNRVAEPLLSAMDLASTAGRAAIISSLAEIGGDRALEVITRATTSPQPEVRNAAIGGLANTWSDSGALPALLQLSKSGATKSDRVLALRGYLRVTGTDDRAPAEIRLSRIQQAMTLAERPEEKRQALSVLRDVRTPGAVELAARALDDPDLVAEASDAILYLAASQKKGNSNLQAVKGPATDQALDKVIRKVKDDNVRAQARKLRQG